MSDHKSSITHNLGIATIQYPFLYYFNDKSDVWVMPKEKVFNSFFGKKVSVSQHTSPTSISKFMLSVVEKGSMSTSVPQRWNKVPGSKIVKCLLCLDY